MTPCSVCGRRVRYPQLSPTYADPQPWRDSTILVCDACEADVETDEVLNPDDDPDEEEE